MPGLGDIYNAEVADVRDKATKLFRDLDALLDNDSVTAVSDEEAESLRQLVEAIPAFVVTLDLPLAAGGLSVANGTEFAIEWTTRAVRLARGLEQAVADLLVSVQRREFRLEQIHDLNIMLLGATETLFEPIEASYHPADDEFAAAIAERRHSQSLRARSTAAVEHIEQQATDVDVVLQSVRRAAGETGDVSLGSAYAEFATREGWVAFGWRAATVLAILGAAFAAIAVASTDATTAELIHRGAITIASAVLAGFFAAEAAKHGRTSTWARVIAVQLRTLDAFSAPLSEMARSAVRESFSRRVFGEIAPAKSETTGLTLNRIAQSLDEMKSRDNSVNSD